MNFCQKKKVNYISGKKTDQENDNLKNDQKKL